MTPDRWARLKALFEQALDIAPANQRAFVAMGCAGDPGLERSLLALLQHHSTSGLPRQGGVWNTEGIAEVVLSQLRAFAPGQIVAERFRVERCLGEGGMGEVYSAEDLELHEQVALKTIRPELAGDDAVLEQFKRELQLARRITHHNVSRVYELFRHDSGADGDRRSTLFISMEMLHGETLANRIASTGALPLADAGRIAAQLVAGLDAAHHSGIIHRDFKSSNVMLVPEGLEPGAGERAVITDFGLAGTLAALAREGTAEGLLGTPAYMAPEQVSGGIITPATDIYAMGIVLFEMLTGRVPFMGPTPSDTAQLRLRQAAPTLRSIAPRAPALWERTIALCLARDPLARPQSAQEVGAHLSGRYLRRRRALQMAATGLFAVAGAGVTWWATRPHRPDPSAQALADRARVKLDNQTRAGFPEAVADYRRAIAIDPRWAEPWAQIAYGYAAAANAQLTPAAAARVEARAAALNAIRLDGGSARAYGALGWVQSFDYEEWPQAETTLRRAIALDPADAAVHYWLGVHLRKKGRFDDSEAATRRALALSRQAEAVYWCELAFLYWTAGRLDRMEEFMGELLVAFPNYGLTRYLHARLLKERSRYEEALEELRFSERLQYSAVTVLAERASIEAYRGDQASARFHLAELARIAERQPVDTLLIAGVYTRLGDVEEAFAWLERGYVSRDNTLLSLMTSPLLVPLRTDPRFADLMRRLHFPPDAVGRPIRWTAN